MICEALEDVTRLAVAQKIDKSLENYLKNATDISLDEQLWTSRAEECHCC